MESEPGRGSTFRVLLPPAGAAVAVPRAASAALQGRLLVVDDEPLIGSAVGRELEDEYEVVTDTSGASALDRIARGETFDLILCDLMMPGMSGMELYQRVVARWPAEAAKFVFFTGGAFTPRAHAFLAGLPNPVIEKPFDGQSLRAAIRRRLALH